MSECPEIHFGLEFLKAGVILEFCQTLVTVHKTYTTTVHIDAKLRSQVA